MWEAKHTLGSGLNRNPGATVRGVKRCLADAETLTIS